ncbi:HEAT repeat-containing protein [Verrucomicrobium sp. GAS474]|uniref:HEAT repeat domain-containing protein n=1 Tax=Verrucomicrobium sp. GAS474 TaxID=1882831 RepID=UPI00087D270F|nr:HEAT repeat domain-containing protein [Verrucomicrobium sp. GAS474]SDU01998.1 HEAT repeat-containing protein [Verrucomicrobium sp. GAS474]
MRSPSLFSARLGLGLVLIATLGLAGCGQEGKTRKRVEALVAANQFSSAYEVLQAGLVQNPKSKTLRREEILLLLKAERVDLAYSRYRAFTAEISRTDSFLFDALKDKDAAVRTSAARVLGMVGEPEAAGPLMNLLDDPNDNVRRAAVVSLGSLKNAKAIPPLVKALKDRWWFVRSEAATALGNMGDVRAVTPLFGVVTDPDGTVRHNAEIALTSLVRQVQDLTPYQKELQSGDPFRIRAATLSLAAVQDKSVTPVLLAYLTAPDPATRQQGLRAFRYQLDPEGLPAIRKCLTDPEPPVRFEAILAVVDYRDREAIPALQAMANEAGLDPRIKQVAAEAAKRLAALPTATPAPAAGAPTSAPASSAP